MYLKTPPTLKLGSRNNNFGTVFVYSIDKEENLETF